MLYIILGIFVDSLEEHSCGAASMYIQSSASVSFGLPLAGGSSPRMAHYPS